MEPKLMSYITAKYTSKADMLASENVWRRSLVTCCQASNMRPAPCGTQVWNSERNFILGNMWEYADEKAFIACQKLFREAEAKHDQRLDTAAIIVPSRGIILHDIRL